MLETPFLSRDFWVGGFCLLLKFGVGNSMDVLKGVCGSVDDHSFSVFFSCKFDWRCVFCRVFLRGLMENRVSFE